ncbi:MAG: hypothetical protein KJO79_05830 [Verrucomicrobiae bacterium]|nr:hypothetical protein [Verrucomicrobiae bacterium]NNJ86683.1 hypothetical protein [Akkermansiaceae bacterium]
MRKELLITPLCSVALAGLTQADPNQSDLYLFLGGTSSVTSVSTSMHDAGSAAASYTLGSGGNSGVQTTTGAPSSGVSGGTSAAYEQAGPGAPSATTSGPSSTGSATGSATAYSGSYDAGAKGGLSAKGGIPIPPAYDPSPLIIAVDGGYQSQYVYNGINRIRITTYDPKTGFGGSTEDFDMYYLGASVKWKGLSVGVKYIRSLDSDMNPLFHPTLSYQAAYSEYLLDINYTLGLIAGPQGAGNWLDATVGYEYTYYPEEHFWNADSQHKFYATLKMNRYKWVRPSVTYQTIDSATVLTTNSWIPGFDILSGEQLIVQVDGGDVLFSSGNVNVALAYYAKAGFASGYNAALDTVLNQDWYQVGVNIPVSINDFVITPSVHYTANDGNLIEEPGFWWGINAKYTF